MPKSKIPGKPRTAPPRYDLKLYVAGMSRRSAEAIQTIAEICEERLKGSYSLQVVDIYQDPAQAKEGQVIAAPTLVRRLPLPLRRLIGDMGDRNKVIISLDLKPGK